MGCLKVMVVNMAVLLMVLSHACVLCWGEASTPSEPPPRVVGYRMIYSISRLPPDFWFAVVSFGGGLVIIPTTTSTTTITATTTITSIYNIRISSNLPTQKEATHTHYPTPTLQRQLTLLLLHRITFVLVVEYLPAQGAPGAVN